MNEPRKKNSWENNQLLFKENFEFPGNVFESLGRFGIRNCHLRWQVGSLFSWYEASAAHSLLFSVWTSYHLQVKKDEDVQIFLLLQLQSSLIWMFEMF